MNNILKILLTFTIVSCSQRVNQKKQKDITNEIETSFISTDSKFDFYNDSVLTHIDAEELCEFSFDFFLPQLNQKLTENNLTLDVQTANDYESSFEIVINKHRVKLYSNEELTNGDFLDKGPRNFFKVVNEILKEKKINKQFYLLYGGNNLHATYLTKKQFESMTKINKDNKNEVPYLP